MELTNHNNRRPGIGLYASESIRDCGHEVEFWRILGHQRDERHPIHS